MPGRRRQRHMVLGIRFGYTLFQRTRVDHIHKGRHTRSKHGKHGRRAQHTRAANTQHARLSTSAQHGMYAGENRGDERARVCRSEHRQSMNAMLTQLHHVLVRCVEDTCIHQSLDETHECQGARPRQISVAWRGTRGQQGQASRGARRVSAPLRATAPPGAGAADRERLQLTTTRADADVDGSAALRSR